MRGNHLRGRMAYSFYVKMGIYDCVATSNEEYINIAVHFGTNQTHRELVSRRLLEKSHLMWEDMQVVKEWERFLYNSVRVLAG